ncbi:Pre-mRNA-splicing factor SYF1 [Spathaspora sp. JA1]|nr:Pre-mRNA-splicing factor SYF1 [Spathaspora sp. JA1]
MLFKLQDLVKDIDIPYEESIAKDPGNISNWTTYLEFKSRSSFHIKAFILHRATKAIPNNETLWQLYLDLLLEHIQGNIETLNDSHYQYINRVFDQAVRCCFTSVQLWKCYIEMLMETQISKVTHIRRVFNSCLRSLPLKLHVQIWPLYLTFADRIGGITGVKIITKYLQYLDPSELQGTKEGGTSLDEIVVKLREFGEVEQTVSIYEQILNHPDQYTTLGKSPVQYLFEYIDLIQDSAQSLFFEKLINDSIQTYPDQIGKLFLKLITFFKQRNDVEKVRYYYDISVRQKCLTSQDFTTLFDEYAEFEESELTKLSASSDLFNFKLDKFENLLNDRSILFNDMKLRQNINNLDVWFDRFDIYNNDLGKLLQTYTEALKSINPLKVVSSPNHKLCDIWIRYASIYAKNRDYKTADYIYSKGVTSQFIHPDELAEIYIQWCEMVLSSDKFPETYSIEILDSIMYREFDQDFQYNDSSITVQNRINKSKKLWNFYIDLLESFIESSEQINDFDKISQAYDVLITKKIITINDILNCGKFLHTWKYHERAWQVYERGLELFVDSELKFEIWNVYLSEIIKIQSDNERIHDLFEVSLKQVPCWLINPILLLYSQYEKDHLRIINSINILIKSLNTFTQAQQTNSTKLPDITSRKFDITSIILIKLIEIKDINQFRQIAQDSIQDEYFTLSQVIQLIKKFIDFEINQGEFNRVRELYKYICGLSNSDNLKIMWESWESFELEHGNESSFKDILRFKRSVNDEVNKIEVVNPMGFVKASEENPHLREEEVEVTNPDQIDLDM